MEKDPQLSKLIREEGLVHAPKDFTRKVMEKISVESAGNKYKPLISRTGRLFILLAVAGMIVLSLIYGEPSESNFMESLGLKGEWNLPQLNLDLGFFSQFSLGTGIVAAVVALFILVLTDAGINRRRFIF